MQQINKFINKTKNIKLFINPPNNPSLKQHKAMKKYTKTAIKHFERI